MPQNQSLTEEDFDKILNSPAATREDIDKIVGEAAAKYKVNPDLVHSIIKQESNYNPQATSTTRDGQHAAGLMQLMPATASRYGVGNPFDPRQNIDGGVRYLRDLIKQHGNQAKAIEAYNGSGPEARKYADEVHDEFFDRIAATAPRVKTRTTPAPAVPPQKPAKAGFFQSALEGAGIPPIEQLAPSNLAETAKLLMTAPGTFAGAMGENLLAMGKGMVMPTIEHGYGTLKALEAGGRALMGGEFGKGLGEYGKAAYELAGAVPFFGPGLHEGLRKLTEGDAPGGSGTLFGTFVLGPMVFGTGPRKLARMMEESPVTNLPSAVRAEQIRRGVVARAEDIYPQEAFQAGVPLPPLKTIATSRMEQIKGGSPGFFRLGARNLGATATGARAVEKAVIGREDAIRTEVDRIKSTIHPGSDITAQTAGAKLQQIAGVEAGVISYATKYGMARAVGRDLGKLPIPEQFAAAIEQEGRGKMMGEQMIAPTRAKEQMAAISPITTPAQAGNLLHNIIVDRVDAAKEVGNAAWNGFYKNLRGNSLSDYGPDLPLTNVFKQAKELLRANEETRQALMNILPPDIRAAFERTTTEVRTNLKGKKTVAEVEEPKTVPAQLLHDLYKEVELKQVATSRGGTVHNYRTNKWNNFREAVLDDLQEGLAKYDQANNTDFSNRFQTLTKNYRALMERSTASLTQSLLADTDPAMQGALVRQIMAEPPRAVQGLFDAMTLGFDGRPLPQEQLGQAYDAIRALKKNALNALVEDNMTRGVGGEERINHYAIFKQLKDNPKLEGLFNFKIPDEGLIPNYYGQLLSYFREQAKIDHSPQRLDASSFLSRFSKADKRNAIAEVVLRGGDKDAQQLATLARNLPDGQKALNLVTAGALFKEALDPTGQRVDTAKLRNILMKREPLLRTLMPTETLPNGTVVDPVRNLHDYVMQQHERVGGYNDFLAKQLIDEPNPERILPSILKDNNITDFDHVVRLLQGVSDPYARNDAIRSAIRSVFTNLLDDSAVAPATGQKGFGQPFNPEGTGGSLLSGVEFNGTYLKVRPQIAKLLGGLPSAQAGEVLDALDQFAKTVRNHEMTRVLISSKGGTKALAAISEIRSPAAALGSSLSAGNPGAIANIMVQVASKIGFMRYMAGPAKGTTYRHFEALRTLPGGETVGQGMDFMRTLRDQYLPPELKQATVRLALQMASREQRKIINEALREQQANEKRFPAMPPPTPSFMQPSPGGQP